LAGRESLCRSETIRQSADYLRCYRAGRRRSGKLILLYCHPNTQGVPRLGITASRKVGPSVLRHRLKRRIREAFRRLPERAGLPAMDLVVHLQKAAGAAAYRELASELSKLLSQAARAFASR